MKPEDLYNKREWELDQLAIAFRKKLSDQQRRFAEYVVSGMTQYESYQKAGYKCAKESTAMENASRLTRNAKVKAYMDVLRERQRRATTVTAEAMMRRFLDGGDEALRKGNHSAAKGMWAEAAKLADLYPALRKHIEIDDHRSVDATQMSDEAWIALFELRKQQKRGEDNPTIN